MAFTPDTIAIQGPAHGPARPVAETYWKLVRAGLQPREAASLLGRLEGLPMIRGGWTLLEVERLFFVRALVRTGRLRS